MILRRKSHNCAETAFVQGDSAGGSKLTEQTLLVMFAYEGVRAMFLGLKFPLKAIFLV